jgi:hypothetical protein
MSNGTGVVYGTITRDGSPVAGATMDIDWIQRTEGGQGLSIGGDDDLTTWVPRTESSSKGHYIIPFFWASEQVPGSQASAHAMIFFDGGSYLSYHQRGQLNMGLDLRRLMAKVTPPIPGGAASAASMFLTFWVAAKPTLKGTGILSRFTSSLALASAEQVGCYSRIDFSLWS